MKSAPPKPRSTFLTTLLGLCMALNSFPCAASPSEEATVLTVPPAPQERNARNESAHEQFLNLNFFTEGGGMHLSPNILKLSEDLTVRPIKGLVLGTEKREFVHRWGLNWENNRAVGLFDEESPNGGKRPIRVGVLGCVACHSGKAAGRFVVGLGNKNIDVSEIGRDAYFVERVWKKVAHPGPKTEDYKYVENTAMTFAKTLGNPKITNLTQGLVPTAVIRQWFYRMAGKPVPTEFHRAAVKVPSLWGYGLKRNIGQFCDGFGNGTHAGWGAAVELVAGQKSEVVRNYIPKVEATEKLLEDFLPPRYPYSIDAGKAARGKHTFESTCANCHGNYESDSAGLPVFQPPQYFDWSVVQTDPDRIQGNTPEFLQLVRSNPLKEFVQANEHLGQGYFAPRLVGIWARFPYLHNGSVPSIDALLTRPEKRPAAFSLRDAGEEYRFDPNTLGLTVSAPASKEAKRELHQGRKGARDIYWVKRTGQSNMGHDFFTDLSEAEKSDLIEYLKTL